MILLPLTLFIKLCLCVACQACKDMILAMSVDERVTEDSARMIAQLWTDPAIMKAMEEEGKLALEGSMS